MQARPNASLPIAAHFAPMQPPERRWPPALKQSAARMAERLGTKDVAFLFSVSRDTVCTWMQHYGSTPAGTSAGTLSTPVQGGREAR